MIAVSFRFYAELNEHLPDERRQVRFIQPVTEGSTVGKAIAAMGVPVDEGDHRFSTYVRWDALRVAHSVFMRGHLQVEKSPQEAFDVR